MLLTEDTSDVIGNIIGNNSSIVRSFTIAETRDDPFPVLLTPPCYGLEQMSEYCPYPPQISCSPAVMVGGHHAEAKATVPAKRVTRKAPFMLLELLLASLFYCALVLQCSNIHLSRKAECLRDQLVNMCLNFEL